MFIVYILQSISDGHYYIGQTNNIEERLKKHNKGMILSTKHRRPFVIVKTETYKTRGEARKRENYLKSLKGGNEFKKIIKMM